MSREQPPPMRPHEHVFTLVLFGGLFLYCLHGAVVGALFVPSRHGSGAVLSGTPAWALSAAPLLFYAGILVRHGTLLRCHSGAARLAVELGLLAAGIGFMLLAVAPPGAAAARCPVSIKPKAGHYIFGIPPVPPETMTMVSATSKVDLLIDGKPVGALRLGDSSPQLEFELTPGRHSFEFVADIVAHGDVPYSGRCSGALQVEAPQGLVLRPWLDFSPDPGDPTRQRLTTCQLIPW